MQKYKTYQCKKCKGLGLLPKHKLYNCNNCHNNHCWLCQNIPSGNFEECSRCMGLGTIWKDKNNKEIVIFSTPS